MGFLVFSVERQAFAVSVERVSEVYQAALPTPTFRPPYGCLGVVAVRGKTVPVLDLAPLLRLRRPLKQEALREALLDRFMVLVTVEAFAVCLVIDAVIDVGEVGADSKLAIAGNVRGQILDLSAVVAPARRRLLERVKA